MDKDGKGTLKSTTCTCGRVVDAFRARVKFPNGDVLEFCNRYCPAYREAMKKADYRWKKHRQRKESEHFGRAQAGKGRVGKKPMGQDTNGHARRKHYKF
jgi:hypothetical protein